MMIHPVKFFKEININEKLINRTKKKNKWLINKISSEIIIGFKNNSISIESAYGHNFLVTSRFFHRF